MSARNAQPLPSPEQSELDAALCKANPVIKQAVDEYRKEILRLQRQLVKEQISHESEKAALLAKLEHSAISDPAILEELNRNYREQAPRIKELRGKMPKDP